MFQKLTWVIWILKFYYSYLYVAVWILKPYLRISHPQGITNQYHSFPGLYHLHQLHQHHTFLSIKLPNSKTVYNHTTRSTFIPNIKCYYEWSNLTLAIAVGVAQETTIAISLGGTISIMHFAIFIHLTPYIWNERTLKYFSVMLLKLVLM